MDYKKKGNDDMAQEENGNHNSQFSTLNSQFENILMNGINFGRGGERKDPAEGKVKTKAKKKKYITGAHGSGSAKQKAKYREQRANRHK
jgi:hypothetical protein